MKEREKSIDFLKAIAILLMTITHVNALLYTGNNIILDIFTTAGATLCFSLFLFSSAYTIGIKIKENKRITFKNTLKRAFGIYIVYLILGIFISFVLDNTFSLKTVLDIALLKFVPEFTEFLIAFIIFSFIPLLFYKQIKYLISKPIYFILLTIFIYILGSVIYSLISKHTYPDILRIPLENIFGYKTLHRFPLTHYLPIYTFGILMSNVRRNRIHILTLGISIFLFAILYLFDISHWLRWPPSILFHLYSFLFIPLTLLIYNIFKKPLSKGIFKIFTNIGMFPLEQFFLSTIFVFLSRLLLNPSENEILSILVNIVIFIVLLLYPIVFHRKMV